MTTKNSAPAANPPQRNQLAFLAVHSPMAKLVVASVISLLLMVPAMMVLGFVKERANRATVVAADIAKGWGGEQTLNGPYLVVPYRKTEESRTQYAVFSAQSEKMSLDVSVEERRRSIYRTPLYASRTKVEGLFAALPADIADRLGIVDYDSAYLAMSVSDLSGFRSEALIEIRGSGKGSFEPGLPGLTGEERPGFHHMLRAGLVRSGFDFSIDMTLNGASRLNILPSGRATEIAMTSDWPHPGFSGRFLPDTRSIGEQGFSAGWTIPSLAQGTNAMSLAAQLPVSASPVSVGFVEPLQFYQVISRTLKYATAFFALTFLAVFILETRAGQPFHWVQYVLVGLALVIFFLLLLALAEHIGFGAAYVAAATATTALIAWYVGDAMRHARSGFTMAGVLGTVYALIYFVMSEEDYALLAGSVVAFLAIAAVMIATRRLDWERGGRLAGPAPDPVPQQA